MLRVVRSRTPAIWPALLFVLLLLHGCALLPGGGDADADAGSRKPVTGEQGKADGRDAFSVEVVGPDAVKEYLEKHLEIQRYKALDDLAAGEVSRLMVAAEANARELLATLGYTSPTLTLELIDTPDDKQAPRKVRVTVEPGEPARVDKVAIGFEGPVATDPRDDAHRKAVRGGWKLPPGQIFTQGSWDGAKSLGLRTLAAKRYPTASVRESRATLDADQHSAELSVTYDSGPAYRFGPLQVNGVQRYSADAARRIARVPSGTDYDQQKLLDAQQRLASSGYYDSVFLTLDTEHGTPDAAPVVAQVREAPFQKVVAGVGFTSDNGPRVSLDHIHNQMPVLGWRAVSSLSIDQSIKSLGTEWTDLPDEQGWRWFGSGLLKRDSDAGSYEEDSARVRAGRNKADGHIDRSLFLQYDYTNNKGIDPPPSASAISANWGWTGRYFNDPANPTGGQGLGVELGLGYTLTGERLPFVRTHWRWLGIFPLGSADTPDGAARRSRFALRGELGGVFAKDAAQIPTTQLFLTGGDTTVRGYSYQQIGVVTDLDQITAGRYLGVASVEWQKPIVSDGKLTDWEGVGFVDAGSVADRFGALEAKVGVGVGARWKSPVGPVQADIAYGVDVKKFRLHLRLGFNF